MNHPDYNSPAALKSFLEEEGMAMQKKFGQNFLVNEKARVALVDALEAGEGSSVWEVGPGLGAMTDELLRRGVNLTVFEIDHGFARLVSDFFAPYREKGRFALVEGDVLKTWQAARTACQEQGELPTRFFGNLPYNVAATIIADMIENGLRFDKMVVTVQKEVGQRMCAKPSGEDYSSFSVLCQWAYDVKPLMDLAGGNFWPRPNVDSRALVLTKKADSPRCSNPRLFVRLTRALFGARRKTVRNNIQGLLPPGVAAEDVFAACGIQPNERAENLPVEKLLALSDALDGLSAKQSPVGRQLQAVRASVAQAARQAGRQADSVRLLAVSKFHPAEAVIEAIKAGQSLFGENRVQEAAEKFDRIRALGYDCQLHIIGQLQRNKVKEAVRIASCIQSVDRLELLSEIEKQCAKSGRTMDVLFELHTAEESKSGFASPQALAEALERCAAGDFPHVIPKGFMTMAPNTSDQEAVRASFRALLSCAREMRSRFPGFSLEELSMGMSQDYPLAIAEGSTMVRIGTAIFGQRG